MVIKFRRGANPTVKRRNAMADLSENKASRLEFALGTRNELVRGRWRVLSVLG